MGVVKDVSAANASLLLNTSGVDLLLSDLVSTNIGGGFFFFFSPLLPNVFIFSNYRW